MAKVSLKKINKMYPNGFHAVKDVDVEIEDKEFIILVGPSGCGKSTTLRMIAGLEEISTGELYIGTKLVNDVAPKDRDIAMVFQNYALYPHMTVYDNMAFSLKLRKKSKDVIDKSVKDAARILGIEELLDRKPKQLSGGQRQRVALGRAIVRSPQVFLMDEPLSNLDAKLRVQMRTELVKLHQKLNTTFVYVTHDQTEAMTMGTRIVVMKDGIVQQIADPKTIYQKPANMFVAGFIGSPQMNFIDCTLEEENGKIHARYFNYKIDIPENKFNTIKSKGYIGKEVVLGIRPENVIINEEEKNMEAEVEVKELLGSETCLYLKIMDNSIIAKVKPDLIVDTGSKVDVLFEKEKIHLFEKETEKTII